MKTDEDVKRDVEKELRLNPDIDVSAIALAVTNRIVILSGYVRSFSQRWEAERTARGVAGATGVINGIEIRLPLLNQRPDQEIVRDAVASIQIELPYSSEQVRVVVHDGWLSLEGRMELNYSKTRAERAVRRVRGVKGMCNLIQVNPRVSPGDVKRMIEESFRPGGEIEGSSVRSGPGAAP